MVKKCVGDRPGWTKAEGSGGDKGKELKRRTRGTGGEGRRREKGRRRDGKGRNVALSVIS